MIVSGSQHALGIAARALLPHRGRVWVEEPGYAGARDALLLAGARLVPVPVDSQGLRVSDGAAVGRRAHAALVTPSHQYPLGATMSAARRLQLLDWASTSGAWVIEDDYDSEYRFESQPISALQGLDRNERVIYVGTFSKVLCPALRVGYLVIPRDLIPRFTVVREAMDIAPPSMLTGALADFIVEGHFARHVRRTAAIYRERRSVLVASILSELGPKWRIMGAEAGMHLVALLPPDSHPGDDVLLAERAAAIGIWAMPLSVCYAQEPKAQGLVLGYGGAQPDEIRTAIRRLSELASRFGWM